MIIVIGFTIVLASVLGGFVLGTVITMAAISGPIEDIGQKVAGFADTVRLPDTQPGNPLNRCISLMLRGRSDIHPS